MMGLAREERIALRLVNEKRIWKHCFEIWNDLLVSHEMC